MDNQPYDGKERRSPGSEITLLSLKFDVMHNDVAEIKGAMRELTSAITKLALIEERITGPTGPTGPTGLLPTPSSTTYGGYYASASKNGYYGILMGSTSTHLNYMADGSGNGGIYQESVGVWPIYWNATDSCLGVDGSTTSSSYSIYVNGSTYTTGNFVAGSDFRIKENIKDITGALNIVMNLRGVYYNKIYTPEKTEVGLIAQEVNEYLPEVVTFDKENDIYGVNYGNIVGVLIEAIKEQQKQIDELKEKLNGN